ncbi:EMB2076, partial [Symbiodinium sp. CCMP2456]
AKAMTSAQACIWERQRNAQVHDKLTVFEATRLVADCTDWQVVMGTLQRLRLHSVAVDVVCLTAACKAVLQALQWQRTLSLFRGAAAVALAANERTYGVALAACAASREGWQDAVHLFGCMPTARLEQNSFLQSAAVTALDAALHGWSAALSLMVQVASSLDLLLWSDSSASTLQAFHPQFHSVQWYNYQVKLSVWLLLDARPRDPKQHCGKQCGVQHLRTALACVTFNSAIASCGAGRWATALWLLGSSIKASVVTYSACISACEKSYQWQLPCSLLFSLCQNGLVPNAVAEGSVLQALTWAAQWRRTSAALQAATPSAPAFNAVLRSLGAAWERGLAELEQMILHRQEPDVCSTNQLLGRQLSFEPEK